MADITKEAGTSFGLFYRYFPDLQSLVSSLCIDMMHNFDSVLTLTNSGTPRDLVYRIKSYQFINVQNHIQHPGLIRAAPEIAMEDIEFRKTMRSLHMKFIEHVIGANPESGGQQEELSRRMRALVFQGVTITVLQDYYVWKTSGLRQMDLSADEMVDWLSILCFRTLTGENPGFTDFDHYSRIKHLL